MTPTGRTVAGTGIGASLAVLIVVAMEMAEIRGLTIERASVLTGALGTVLGWLVHKLENKNAPTQ